MRQLVRKTLYPFILPNGLVFVLLAIGLAQTELPENVAPFFDVLPYAVVGAGLLLGWRFNRTRLVHAIVLLTVAEVVILYGTSVANRFLVFELIVLLLPANLWLVSCFKERGLLHPNSFLWCLFLATELLVVAWLVQEHQSFLRDGLNYSLLPLPQGFEIPASQLSLLVNSLALVLFAVKSYRRNSVFEASFFWAQSLLLIAFLGLGVQPFRLYLAGAGLILVLGIMESSHSLAYRDELTGLLGRRALDESMAKLGSCYTLAMLDIDHFKKFNDTHGHDVGDQVLKMVASKLSQVAGGGKVFRYGGEEFAAVFPRKSIKEARPFLEALRIAVEDARFITRGKDRPKKKPKQKPVGKKRSPALRVTISIGAAERTDQLNIPQKVIKAADEALYRAKKAGRNLVSL